MHMIDMFDSIDMQTAYILGYIMVDRLQKGFDGSLSVRYSTIKCASLILGYFRAQVTPMSLTPGTIPWARIRCSTPPSTWTRTPVVTLALLTVAQLSSPGLSVMEWVDGMCWSIRQSRKCGRRWNSFFLCNLLWFLWPQVDSASQLLPGFTPSLHYYGGAYQAGGHVDWPDYCWLESEILEVH